MFILLTLSKFKIKVDNKSPVGETGCLSIFLGPYLVSLALHPGFSHWWRCPLSLSSTPTRGYFFECLGIQFFNSLTCDIRDAMPRQGLPTLLPREAEDFLRGDRHFKHVPPLTYLIWLSPKALHMLGLFKCYGFLSISSNVSYEIWTLVTKGSPARSSLFYHFGYRPLWSMAD